MQDGGVHMFVSQGMLAYRERDLGRNDSDLLEKLNRSLAACEACNAQ